MLGILGHFRDKLAARILRSFELKGKAQWEQVDTPHIPRRLHSFIFPHVLITLPCLPQISKPLDSTLARYPRHGCNRAHPDHQTMQ